MAPPVQPPPPPLRPQPIGLRKTFGFGDRLGRATPGQLAAARRFSFAPVFAQQSMREMQRAARTPEEVVQSAARALGQAAFKGAWGADADRVGIEADLERTAAAGFTTFSLDASAHVENRALSLPSSQLPEAVAATEKEAVFPPGWSEPLLRAEFEAPGLPPLSFDSESLSRAAVRFGRALAHVQRLLRHLSRLMPADQREIEVVLLEAGSPVSPLEHLFLAHELRRRGIPIVGLALPFARDWEVGADLPGDLDVFEETLRIHAAIARHHGPYKLGFHAGMAKERALPVVGRVCGELLHVKSTGASYLEALRVVCRRAPGLFGEIIEFARGRFATDRPAQGMATTPGDVGRLMAAAVAGSMERVVFDTKAGRQLLEATWGSVVSLGRTAQGRPLKAGIVETLDAEPTLYRDLLDACFTRHLGLLNEG